MRFLPVVLFFYLFGACASAIACDICSVYTADLLRNGMLPGFSLSVAEQFTGFHNLQDDGKHVENVLHQSMTSSITQTILRYRYDNTFGAQLALPYIHREFDRPEDGVMQSGTESGIGDASILGLYTPYQSVSQDYAFFWNVRAGIKLPTGDASRLREEQEEIEGENEEEHHEEESGHGARGIQSLQHNGEDHGGGEGTASAIHGHDLALGSGSFDYVFGTSTFFEIGRFFNASGIQYVIRTEGDFNYRYQNDLTWETGFGSNLLSSHERTFALKATLTGEYKGMDVSNGNKASDTGINSMFLGPEINYTEGSTWLVQLALDLPVFVDNTDLQIVPDYRVRANVTCRF